MSHDRQFFDTFMLVLGILVAFTVVIYVLAIYVGGRTQAVWITEDPLYQQRVEGRIQPLGSVAVAGESPATATGAAAATPGSTPSPDAAMAATGGTQQAISGENVYNNACMACHMIGAAGAPKLGDKDDWGPRIAQGMDVLVGHAINGYQGQKGIMPAKGGRADLSDEQVRAAVEYMTAQAM